jgi:hypothetical protein
MAVVGKVRVRGNFIGRPKSVATRYAINAAAAIVAAA